LNGNVVTVQPSVLSKSVKRTFTASGTIQSTAAGAITLAATGCQDLITSLGTEFSNYGQEYSEFNVKKIGLHLFPSTTSATSTTGPYQGGFVMSDWAQLKPTTLTSMFQSDALIKKSTLEEFEYNVRAPNLPNFKLWNPIGTAIPIDRDFGFAYSSVSTLAVSSNIYSALFELDVEFRLPY